MTLNVMVKKMTPHNALVQPAFHQIFMMTWQLFTTPSEFVNALIGQYNLQPSIILMDNDHELWVKWKVMPVKLLVSYCKLY